MARLESARVKHALIPEGVDLLKTTVLSSKLEVLLAQYFKAL